MSKLILPQSCDSVRKYKKIYWVCVPGSQRRNRFLTKGSTSKSFHGPSVKSTRMNVIGTFWLAMRRELYLTAWIEVLDPLLQFHGLNLQFSQIFILQSNLLRTGRNWQHWHQKFYWIPATKCHPLNWKPLRFQSDANLLTWHLLVILRLLRSSKSRAPILFACEKRHCAISVVSWFLFETIATVCSGRLCTPNGPLFNPNWTNIEPYVSSDSQGCRWIPPLHGIYSTNQVQRATVWKK